MNPIRVFAPATTANLGPGFDCLGMSLDLWNRLDVGPASPGADAPLVEVTGEGQGELPADEGNLVYRAMEFLFHEAGEAIPALHLRCENRIPLSRGLGSSAAAIAGGLVAANALCGSPFSPNELLEMAATIEGHPDNVAAAVMGGLRLVVSDTLVAVSTPDGVPSFIGLPRAEAFLRAQAADLAVSFDEQSVPNLPEGVILQEPAPGVAATAITLTMNTHPVAIPTPAIGVEIRAAEPRQVAFQWPIESGIPEVTATVFATTLEGETSLVQIRRIQGGETLEGVWTTTSLGPIIFELMLNDQPYGVTLRVP